MEIIMVSFLKQPGFDLQRRHLMFGAILILSFSLCCLYFGTQVFAIDPVDEIQQQIDELEKLKKMSSEATKPLEKELAGLEQKVKNAQAGIVAAKQQAQVVSQGITKREEDLAVQYMVFSSRIAASYRRSRTYSPFLLFLSSDNATQLLLICLGSSNFLAKKNSLRIELRLQFC